ncbi:MAG: ATP-binding cassette domain-containing protein [Deltaproteobacteria bacterium]|nr:ATP-binding cassette domain-containing protein [Deltaproteobacteria bacterium]
MAVLSLLDVSISFGGAPLLDRINLQVEKGERVCILGRNGEGKSTLLKLISGHIRPDSGTISTQKGISISGLSQELPQGLNGTVHEVVSGGLAGVGGLLEEYHRLSKKISKNHDDAILKKITDIHEKLDRLNGWEAGRLADEVITRLSLDPDEPFSSLSVGFKRRALLARALVNKPDLLLLDEPTNHLDVASITWMEEFLEKYSGTIIIVTHDRMFLQKLATRIIEIDRGNILNWACGYSEFLKRREEVLETEELHRNEFRRKLAQEEDWIRKGVKARRTRNEGRVRALIKMREEQRNWRMKSGVSRITLQDTAKSGKLVIEAVGVSHGFHDRPVIKNLSTVIIRGDRIGVIGPNGAGKTTLLKILLGKLVPDMGQIKHGTKLEITYFDQLREELDEDATVEASVADGKDTVIINDTPRHIIGYLKDFLFTPDRAKSPVRILSGGERNRLLIARLFVRPSNLLVLDEPTNDLDMETLELLEERLMDYKGTIILVSHDRAFLNNVVTSTIVFDENGKIAEYPGGYDDWIAQRPARLSVKESQKTAALVKQQVKKEQPRRLSFKETKELEGLPPVIEKLEQEQRSLYEQMADPEFYKKNGEQISGVKTRMEQIKKELDEGYRRWEELEGIKEASS